MNDTAESAADATRARALQLLEDFSRRLLPGFVRRQIRWKRLSSDSRELVTDLRHRIAVDCLERPAALCAMAVSERNARWFRLLENEVRRGTRQRSGPGEAPVALDELPAPAVMSDPELRDLIECVPRPLRALLDHGFDHDGRPGLLGTAERLGICTTGARRMWVRLAERLGYGDDFLGFWRRRLGEVVLGMAADHLLASNRLQLLDGARWTDPRRRRRRLCGIRGQMRVRPLPADLKKTLASVRHCGKRAADFGEAVLLLRTADRLLPFDPAVPLWRFEAALLQDDLALAARCLRKAQHLGGAQVGVVLARARLLEVRGRGRAAERLLSRAIQRQRGEPKLIAALRAFGT